MAKKPSTTACLCMQGAKKWLVCSGPYLIALAGQIAIAGCNTLLHFGRSEDGFVSSQSAPLYVQRAGSPHPPITGTTRHSKRVPIAHHILKRAPRPVKSVSRNICLCVCLFICLSPFLPWGMSESSNHSLGMDAKSDVKCLMNPLGSW